MSEQANTGEDHARGKVANNAQITLISILLGAILGALFMGIPPNFAAHVWALQALPLDLRVFATFLAAVDMWIEYSWAVIAHRWPFSLSHNLAYFAIAGSLIGVALSVNQLSAWLAWAVAACITVTVESFIDILVPIRRRLKKDHVGRAEQKAAKAESYVGRLVRYRKQTWQQVVVYVAGVPLLLYGSLSVSNAVPPWAELRVTPWLWGALGIALVAIDMLIEARSMIKQRYEPALIF